MPIIGVTASAISGNLGPSVQYYFERIFNGSKTTNATRCVRDSTGNIYTIVQDLTNGTGGFYATAVFKTDNTGVVQWSKYWTNQGYNFDIGITSAGVLFIGTQQSQRLTAYIKLDTSTGAQSGAGVYYNTGVTYRGGVAIDTDGNIWGAGNLNNGMGNVNGPHKVPSDLTSSMSLYGVGDGTYFDGICALPNGDVTALGTDSPGNNYRPILVSTTKAGSFNWAKTWGSHYSTSTYMSIATDSSSNIYVGSWIADSGTTGAYAFVMKFNSSGTLQWQQKLDNGTGTGQYIYAIDVDSSGNVYAVGLDNTSPQKGILWKLDSSGTTQWQRSMNNSNLNGVEVLSTGELLVSGTWKSLSSGGTDQTLVIRVPADGSKTGTYTVGGTSIVYAASSYTISNPSFSISTYATGWASTPTLSANSYTPSIQDYGATQQVVTI